MLAVQGDEPRLGALRERDEIATGIRHLLRGEVLARLLALGEEEARERLDAAAGRAGGDGRLQVLRLVLVALAAGAQGGRQHRQQLFGERLGQLGDEGVAGDPGTHAEGGAQPRLDGGERVLVVRALGRAELGQGLLQDVVERVVDGIGDGRLQGRPQRACLRARGFGQHLVGRLPRAARRARARRG